MGKAKTFLSKEDCSQNCPRCQQKEKQKKGDPPGQTVAHASWRDGDGNVQPCPGNEKPGSGGQNKAPYKKRQESLHVVQNREKQVSEEGSSVHGPVQRKLASIPMRTMASNSLFPSAFKGKGRDFLDAAHDSSMDGAVFQWGEFPVCKTEEEATKFVQDMIWDATELALRLHQQPEAYPGFLERYSTVWNGTTFTFPTMTPALVAKHPEDCKAINHILAGSTVEIVNLNKIFDGVADVCCPQCGGDTETIGYSSRRARNLPPLVFRGASTSGLFHTVTATQRQCRNCPPKRGNTLMNYFKFDDTDPLALNSIPAAARRAVGFSDLMDKQSDTNGVTEHVARDVLFHCSTNGSVGMLHRKQVAIQSQKYDENVTQVLLCNALLLSERLAGDVQAPIISIPHLHSVSWALIKKQMVEISVPTKQSLMDVYSRIQQQRSALYDESLELSLAKKDPEKRNPVVLSYDHNWAMAKGCQPDSTLLAFVDNTTGAPITYKIGTNQSFDSYAEDLKKISESMQVKAVFIDNTPQNTYQDGYVPPIVEKIKELTGAEHVGQDIMHVEKNALETMDETNENAPDLRKSVTSLLLQPHAPDVERVAGRILDCGLKEGSYVMCASKSNSNNTRLMLDRRSGNYNPSTRKKIVDLLFEVKEGADRNMIERYIQHGSHSNEVAGAAGAVETCQLLQVLEPSEAFWQKFKVNIRFFTPSPENWSSVERDIKKIFEPYIPPPSQLESRRLSNNLCGPGTLMSILNDPSTQAEDKVKKAKQEVERLIKAEEHDDRLREVPGAQTPKERKQLQLFANRKTALAARDSLIGRAKAALDPPNMRHILSFEKGEDAKGLMVYGSSRGTPRCEGTFSQGNNATASNNISNETNKATTAAFFASRRSNLLAPPDGDMTKNQEGRYYDPGHIGIEGLVYNEALFQELQRAPHVEIIGEEMPLQRLPLPEHDGDLPEKKMRYKNRPSQSGASGSGKERRAEDSASTLAGNMQQPPAPKKSLLQETNENRRADLEVAKRLKSSRDAQRTAGGPATPSHSTGPGTVVDGQSEDEFPEDLLAQMEMSSVEGGASKSSSGVEGGASKSPSALKRSQPEDGFDSTSVTPAKNGREGLRAGPSSGALGSGGSGAASHWPFMQQAEVRLAEKPTRKGTRDGEMVKVYPPGRVEGTYENYKWAERQSEWRRVRGPKQVVHVKAKPAGQ